MVLETASYVMFVLFTMHHRVLDSKRTSSYRVRQMVVHKIIKLEVTFL